MRAAHGGASMRSSQLCVSVNGSSASEVDLVLNEASPNKISTGCKLTFRCVSPCVHHQAEFLGRNAYRSVPYPAELVACFLSAERLEPIAVQPRLGEHDKHRPVTAATAPRRRSSVHSTTPVVRSSFNNMLTGKLG